MEQDYKEKQRKSYTLMRTIYDAGMGLLILGMGIVLFFGSKKIPQIAALDPLMRNMLGGMFVLYGGFRLYRGIKRQY
ncbi:hypothetical protein [Deminuibacter soli]|uniref:Uncharacterized protein n=1 Tax=Deminuibacter soli TaxID=2291815 RepID=A0A3E1NNX6_9BACT|nr:hypothetical protein [Deminuibacter soli]RFM29623.1 hypothetical protein DXN05_01165 [Deminuibacter soli]